MQRVLHQYVVSFNSTSEYFGDAKVLIVSYGLMECNIDWFAANKFGRGNLKLILI